jgi:hypothetical protein
MGRELFFASEPKWVYEICSSPRLHILRKLSARGGQRLICQIPTVQAMAGGGKRRGTASTTKAGSGKDVQKLRRQDHLAYLLPGPGNVAKIPHHLLPVPKSPKAKYDRASQCNYVLQQLLISIPLRRKNIYNAFGP